MLRAALASSETDVGTSTYETFDLFVYFRPFVESYGCEFQNLRTRTRISKQLWMRISESTQNNDASGFDFTETVLKVFVYVLLLL